MCKQDLDPEIISELEKVEAKAFKALRAKGKPISYHPHRTVRVPGPKPHHPMIDNPIPVAPDV